MENKGRLQVMIVLGYKNRRFCEINVNYYGSVLNVKIESGSALELPRKTFQFSRDDHAV